jgi:sRNA-binding protein
MSTVESTLELLRERFPKCFVRYPQPRQPLKIGVHKDLAVVLAGVVSKSEIGRALTAYTNDVAYREALKLNQVASNSTIDGLIEVLPFAQYCESDRRSESLSARES